MWESDSMKFYVMQRQWLIAFFVISITHLSVIIYFCGVLPVICFRRFFCPGERGLFSQPVGFHMFELLLGTQLFSVWESIYICFCTKIFLLSCSLQYDVISDYGWLNLLGTLVEQAQVGVLLGVVGMFFSNFQIFI